jgi:hypothetical protein
MAITVNIETPPRISESFTQTGHGFVVGDVVIRKSDNTWFKARATDSGAGRALGIVTAVADANNFTLTFQGYITTGVPVATAGTVFYVDPATGGALTSTPDLNHQIPVLVVVESGASAVVMLGIDSKRITQWLFGDIATVLASGTTRYCFLWGSTGTPQVTESLRQNVGMRGTYSLFTFNTVTAQPVSGSLVLTSRVAGVDSTITATVAAGSAAGTYEDLVNVIADTGLNNSLYGLKLVNNATANSTQVISTRILYNSH